MFTKPRTGTAIVLLALATIGPAAGQAQAETRLDPMVFQQVLRIDESLLRALETLAAEADKSAKRQIGGVQAQVRQVAGGLEDLTGSGEIDPDGLPDLCKVWDDSLDGLKGLSESGDYNSDGVVDAADYAVWRESIGTIEAYYVWRDNFGKACK